MRVFMKKIFNLFFLKNSIKKNTRYLEPGTYSIDNVTNLAWRKDYNTVKFVEDNLVKNTYNLKREFCFKGIVKGILSPKKIMIKDQNQDECFKGTVFFLSHSVNKDIKIFNVRKKEVLSIYSNADKLKKKILDYNYFRLYFDMPCIKFFDFNRNISIEELVISKDKKDWNQNDYEALINGLFHSYINYYKSILKKNDLEFDSVSSKINWLKSDSIFSNIGYMLETRISKELMSIEIPIFYQHGDLWLPNILVRENKEQSICLIDWEDSGEFFFFYDLFFLIGTESLHSNSDYLKKYLEGRYDTYMIKLFSTVNMEFNQNKRKFYFLFFLAEMICEKMANKTNEEKKVQLRNYTFLLTEVDKW